MSILQTANEPAPDFRHVRTWLFDLDNTLYRADCGVFAQIESRMTDYVARFTGLGRDEARALQKTLYRAHGTTLNGLMRLYGADPDDYLAYVHDIDLSSLTPDHDLIAAVERLPGRRAIFTNGCRHHAGRILEKIGATHLFKHDLESGARQTHDFGADRYPGEFVFVPRHAEAAEDEGWLIGLVVDMARQITDLAILDAARFEDAPVATIRIPHRVPPGFHGNWLPRG